MLGLLYGESPRIQDLVIIHVAAVIAAILLVFFFLRSSGSVSFLAVGVVALLALDEAGGIVANATRSTNDWYRRRSVLLSYGFLAAHIVQPLLMVWVLGLSWPMFWFLYLYQFAAGALLVWVRMRAWQKPLAAALLGVGVVFYGGIPSVQPVLMILGVMYLVKLVFMFPVDHYATT